MLPVKAINRQKGRALSEMNFEARPAKCSGCGVWRMGLANAEVGAATAEIAGQAASISALAGDL
jgi:hypothetical protein